jgi:hypothetical protein
MARTAKRFESRAPAGGEHGDRDGQHLDSGLERAQSEDQLEIERDDEEDPHEYEVLAEHPDQTRTDGRDPGQ